MYYNLANECDIKLAHLHGRIGTEQNTLRPGGHSKGENDMKRTKKVIALALVLVMAAALLSGCGETGSAGAAASGKTYNLVYQCAWGSGGGPYQYASDLSEAIVNCSGGRVTMECLATNSIVPTTDMLQAVSNGTLDCAQTAATNLSDDSLGILSTLPVGMTFDEYMGWYVAGEGQQILDEVMLKAIPEPRRELAKTAPKMIQMKINPDKIREVIGSGGKVIQKITADTGCKIDINDDGSIFIASSDIEACRTARKTIEDIVFEPEVGALYYGKVSNIRSDFGAWVELVPGKDGLVKIKDLEFKRTEKVEDVLKVGDMTWVKVTEIDDRGRVNLSRKEALKERGEA